MEFVYRVPEGMLVIGHGTAWLAHHTPSSLLSLRFFSAQLVCPFLCEALSLQISQYLQQEILGADPRLPVSSGHSHSIPAWGCPLSGFSSSSMGHRQRSGSRGGAGRRGLEGARPVPPAPRLLSWGGLGSQRLRSLPSRLANSPRLPAVELLVLVTPECVPFVPASSLRCPSLPILRVTPRGYSRTPCPWSRGDPLLSRTRGAGEVCPRVCGCRDGLIPPL